ncbi:MAG TPA: hypothetical protein VHE13_01435 [Opitutus sp.]|nr:hypothetical protein [Opitutus sp.]
MSFAEFAASAARDSAPPAGLGAALQALWQDARGDWDAAHATAQGDADGEGAWVHAYLHRKEGDIANAGYWYHRARRAPPADGVTLAEEWEQIARTLLGDLPKS